MFAYPWLLLLLVVPAWLLHWVWTRQSGRIALPHDHSAPADLRWWARAIHTAESIPAIALACTIILVAGPLTGGEPVSKRKLTNIELLVDVSLSMNWPIGDRRRYDVAMEALNRFVDARPDDAFGLTFFGGHAMHWVPITNDVSAIKLAAPFMDPNKVPLWFMGTNIGNALMTCRDQFAGCEEGDRMAIVLSDGESQDFQNVEGNDLIVADAMKKAGIKVYTVHIGEGEIPSGVRTVAEITGGAAFAADHESKLQEVLVEIDKMRRTEMEKQMPEQRDFFLPAALSGLSVVLLSLMTAFGVRYTPW